MFSLWSSSAVTETTRQEYETKLNQDLDLIQTVCMQTNLAENVLLDYVYGVREYVDLLLGERVPKDSSAHTANQLRGFLKPEHMTPDFKLQLKNYKNQLFFYLIKARPEFPVFPNPFISL